MLQPIDTQSVFEETRTFSKKGKKSCRYLIGCAHKLDRNVTKKVEKLEIHHTFDIGHCRTV